LTEAMFQRWENLLFAHWRVEPAAIASKIPRGLTLDLREGAAWVAVTPFVITRLRLRGLPPIPGASRFPELNVRTYVTAGAKPGVWFFSLDAGSRLAVFFARRLYHLAYSALKPEGLLMFDVVNRAVRQRLDTKEGDCPKDELNVYDVTYSPTDFRREMERQGFSVVSLRPVLQHFELQTWISYTFDHRWRTMADVAVRFLEKWPSHEPLEWVALCRKVV